MVIPYRGKPPSFWSPTCGAPAPEAASEELAASWAAACTTLHAAGKILWAAWKFNCNSEVVCEGEALRLRKKKGVDFRWHKMKGGFLWKVWGCLFEDVFFGGGVDQK